MMGVSFVTMVGVAYPPLPGRAERGITCSKATIAC